MALVSNLFIIWAVIHVNFVTVTISANVAVEMTPRVSYSNKNDIATIRAA